jgi:amino acid transporter
LAILFGSGLAVGGPATMVISWIVVSFFTVFVVCTVAEIASTTPLSGGPYSWSAVIAPPETTAFIPWITGWQVQIICIQPTVSFCKLGGSY